MAFQQQGMHPLGGRFNFPKPKNQWDINVGDLGFSEGYGEKLDSALGGIFQQQLQDTSNQARENSLASGSFNPQVSQYYATKGAQEAQAKGKVDAMGQARADEYNRFNVRNAINNFNLQKDYFNLQKEQYDDSKPSWLDDLFSIAGGVLPFFAGGGEVKGSDYYQMAYGGGIPVHEVNSTLEANGDSTLIKAQPGEIIHSNPAGNLVGRDNLKLINEAGQMAQNMFGDSAQNMANTVRKPMGANLGMNAIKNALGGLFKGSGSSQAQPMNLGGMAGDGTQNPFKGDYDKNDQIYQALLGQYQSTSDPVAKQQLGNALQEKLRIGQELAQKMQEWDAQNSQQQQAPNTVSPQGQGVPGMNQGGQVQKKVIIEEKPAGY